MDKFGVIQQGMTPERDGDSSKDLDKAAAEQRLAASDEQKIADAAEQRCSTSCKCRQKR